MAITATSELEKKWNFLKKHFFLNKAVAEESKGDNHCLSMTWYTSMHVVREKVMPIPQFQVQG